MANGLDSVTEMVIAGILPFCLTPELYAARPEYVDALADFVRSRPMPPVDAFMRQSEAVLTHDATTVLDSIQAPTLITYGRHDIVTSTRFAAPLTDGIANTELIVFEDCAHAAIYLGENQLAMQCSKRPPLLGQHQEAFPGTVSGCDGSKLSLRAHASLFILVFFAFCA